MAQKLVKSDSKDIYNVKRFLFQELSIYQKILKKNVLWFPQKS